MARFIFKLEPVLRQRRLAEDRAQRDLARLLRERMILERRIGDLQHGITADKRTMASALSGHVDVERVRNHGAAAHRAVVQVQQIAMKLLELSHQVEAARTKLIAASRDRKAVERLRDKQYQRWQTERNRRETAQLDEFAIQQFARRNGRSWGAVA